MSSSRLVKKIERPRPLKLGNSSNRLSAIELSTVDDVLSLLENIAKHLSQNNYDPSVLRAIPNLSMSLKIWGPQLEQLYKDQLDKLQVALRNACRDETLDLVSRLHLLEIIELRAMNWQPNENVTNYYKQKLAQIEHQDPSRLVMDLTSLNVNAPDFTPITSSGSQSAPILGPGDILKPSGKFARPTKIPGKNYVKDEVVIKNADSGKVMGLKGRRVHMIEELSETVISFQRVVPGAKERLVQITGPAETNVEQAKALMEETIRRNQSPARDTEDMNQVSDTASTEERSTDSRRSTLIMEVATIGEFKYTVNVGEEAIKIFGNNAELVRTAKIVLDEYFSHQPPSARQPDRMSVDDDAESIPTTRRSSDSSSSLEPIRPHKSNVLREPLFPAASKEAFQQAETDDQAEKKQIRQRRANFAKTAKERRSAAANPPTPLFRSSAPVISYDRKFLLDCADSKASHRFPSNWESITMELPQIDRKVKSVHSLPVDWEAVFKNDPLMRIAVLNHVNLKRSNSDPTAKAKKQQQNKAKPKTRKHSSEEEHEHNNNTRRAPVISDKSVLLTHLKVDSSVEKSFAVDAMKESTATRS